MQLIDRGIRTRPLGASWSLLGRLAGDAAVLQHGSIRLPIHVRVALVMSIHRAPHISIRSGARRGGFRRSVELGCRCYGGGDGRVAGRARRGQVDVRKRTRARGRTATAIGVSIQMSIRFLLAHFLPGTNETILLPIALTLPSRGR